MKHLVSWRKRAGASTFLVLGTVFGWLASCSSDGSTSVAEDSGSGGDGGGATIPVPGAGKSSGGGPSGGAGAGAPGADGGTASGEAGAPGADGGVPGVDAGAGGVPACTGANCGSTTRGDKGPGEDCAEPAECRSGRCEPVTGSEEVVCLGACFADGAPCERALDCCSTGCFDGECGALCVVEGEDCDSPSECCSNLCEEGRCAVDEANPDCRPTGEDCTSGSSRGCCNECDEATDRCGFGADTCFAQGAPCSASSECCQGECTGGVCRTPCTELGDACDGDAECCSSSCSPDGLCATPGDPGGGGASGVGGADAGGGDAGGAPGQACVFIGDECADSADCCSGLCFGGFCERQVP